MNENTLRCVIKKNSNMNNSLIIGEGFFLLYLSRLHIGLFSRLPANARSAWLRSAFSYSRAFRKRRLEGILPFLPCTSILAHLFPYARAQSTFFFLLPIRPDSSCNYARCSSGLVDFFLQNRFRRSVPRTLLLPGLSVR